MFLNIYTTLLKYWIKHIISLKRDGKMTEKRKNELTAYAKKIATLSKVAIIDRIIKMLPLLTTGALSYILFVAEENINIQEQETEDIEE